MDIALRELPDYEEYTNDVTKDGIGIFDYTRAHFEFTVSIFNLSKVPMYCKTRDGKISKIPQRSALASPWDSPDVYVEIQHWSRTQSKSTEISTKRYKLNPSKLCRGCAIRLKDLDIWVSPDKQLLEHVELEKQVSLFEQLKDLVHRALHGMRQCPISVILSDPTGEINYVYAIVDRSIYKLPVLHTREYGKHCLVKFAALDHTDSDAIFDFTLDEMLEKFKQREAFTPKIGSYEVKLFGTLEDAQDVLSKINTEYTKRLIGISAREKEAIRLEYSDQIARLESQVGDLTRQNDALKKQVEVMSGLVKLEDESKKREHSEKIQDLQLDKEKAKVEKSANDVVASSVGASAASVKAATIIVPAVCGILGIAAVKFGWIGGVAGTLNSIISKVTGGCVSSSFIGAVKSALAAPFVAASSIAKAAWSGVTSVCSSIGSWVSSWF